jgi:hypothetical protein
LLLASCASTRLTETWLNPSVAPLHFRKVLVMAVVKGAALRRIAEDAMVQALRPARAVPSYRIVSDAEILNPARALAHLQRDGFDGAITLRIVSNRERLTYVPGQYAPDFLAYWWSAWPPVYQPGYVVTDRVVRVETNVYSLPDQQLVWAGLSRTLNPSSFGRLAEGIAKAVGARLRREGVVA